MTRVALVGTGFIASVHADAILAARGLELACVVQRTPRDPAWGDRYGVPTFRALPEAARAVSFELVAVTVPTGAHVAVAIEALDLDKHVVVEKPADITLERIDTLLAAEEAAGRTVSVISQHRFDPATSLVAELIDAGSLGRITSAIASTPWWRPQSYFDGSDWRGTWQHDGGGALINQGIHALDELVHLLGRPVEVFAWTATLAHHIEVEDTAVGVVRFESGALAALHATTAANPGLNVSLSVMGSEGSALIENHRLRYLHRSGQAEDDPEVRERPMSSTNQLDDLPVGLREAVLREEPLRVGHTRQYEAIADALTGLGAGEGVRPPVPLVEHRSSLALVLGLYRSARTGMVVPL
ncbi:Gfo/Idh/MocA family protein [Aestuariimicrobium sp. T2.26MG-19.2B]|uniref:Gfo/Idh/MocA family protein n=1 Tax=Aestuariimicrobium sp. T2.26MG-19.2B TaxID=3040679 RepID=UPI0024779863|nr:Gfo/Idh/MocA family oxidoreductase [Aestuariimicrobium sp. T2.26MG-19.2B]CAI9405466.1 Inositol 2-dehydrogenase/D-chiro-inositol 3-dehydrogenase [Aestuariimicrobium sp. T2.26MG-19.2B]